MILLQEAVQDMPVIYTFVTELYRIIYSEYYLPEYLWYVAYVVLIESITFLTVLKSQII